MKITDMLDRPIAYHRVFVTLTGSVKAAVLLSQAMYWQKRAKQSDGWWYKTAEEWEEETGLTRHELDKARKDCANFLETDLRDAPARLYWHVDETVLSSALFDETSKSSLAESGKLDLLNPTNINRNTETTPETTNIKKGDLVDGLIAYVLHPKAIRDAMATHFWLTPNWETKESRQFMEWANDEQITPEQIKKAAELWKSDKKFNWQHPSLKLVREHWLALTEVSTSPDTPYEYSLPAYQRYVPEEKPNAMTPEQYREWKKLHPRKK